MSPRPRWMRTELRYAMRAATVGLLVGLICLLAACGGSDEDLEPDPADKTSTPPPCQTRPELCK